MPQGATWNYTEEGLFLAEEFEAVRNGQPLPKKTPPKVKKTAAKLCWRRQRLLNPLCLLRPGARLKRWASGRISSAG